MFAYSPFEHMPRHSAASWLGLVGLINVLGFVIAAPFDMAQPNTTSDSPVLVTQVVTSSVQVTQTSTVVLQTIQPTLAPSPSDDASTSGSTLQQSNTTAPQQVPTAGIIIVTATSTPPPVTVTVSVPATTVTQTVTAIPNTNPNSSTTSSGAQTVWSAPAQMTDLASFNVTYFPYGQHNMAIVGAMEPQANASTIQAVGATAVGSAGDASIQDLTTPNMSSAALQLFYPAGSVNPESQPQGGADFYASPIDLSDAQNVTMEYSVFFPSDFDWVLAGKLPGLYGGHSGCSGGNDALSCFSTRLMWRAKGAGELYLYAPKDKQTKALCSAPPQSVCDQDYGLSIGRGSFNFTPGAWTHVKQTVSLNTPGGQDGGFVLEVNGREVMRRADVFYRDVAVPSGQADGDGDNDSDSDGDELDEDEPGDGDDGSGDDDNGDDGENEDPGPAPSEQPSPSAAPPEPTTEPAPALLDPSLADGVPLLGPLLNGLRFRVMETPQYIDFASKENVSDFVTLATRDDSMPLWLSGANSPIFILPPVDKNGGGTSSLAPPTMTVIADAATQTVSIQVTATAVVYVNEGEPSPTGSFSVQAQANTKPVGFTGLFFSTFFGGHDEKYASPKDQYTWFKDFAITVNS